MSGPAPRDPLERFREKVAVTESGCWEWQSTVTKGGYPTFGIPGGRADGSWGMVYAHRWIYEQVHGEIPDGLHIGHRCHDESDCAGGEGCRHRRCVNPEHLAPMTPQENLLAGRTIAARHAAKTHCPRGHRYEGDNLILDGGSRKCRECKRRRSRAIDRRRRLARQAARLWREAVA